MQVMNYYKIINNNEILNNNINVSSLASYM